MTRAIPNIRTIRSVKKNLAADVAGLAYTVVSGAATSAIQAATGARRCAQDLIGIYLKRSSRRRDGGLERARRVAGTHRRPGNDGVLQRFTSELARDRAALLDLIGALSVPVRGYKVYAA